jgi:hypothetical protein
MRKIAALFALAVALLAAPSGPAQLSSEPTNTIHLAGFHDGG